MFLALCNALASRRARVWERALRAPWLGTGKRMVEGRGAGFLRTGAWRTKSETMAERVATREGLEMLGANANGLDV